MTYPIFIIEDAGASAHTSLSPIRLRKFQKGALDSQPQVRKFTSCLPMVSGSLRVLRFPPSLQRVSMI